MLRQDGASQVGCVDTGIVTLRPITANTYRGCTKPRCLVPLFIKHLHLFQHIGLIIIMHNFTVCSSGQCVRVSLVKLSVQLTDFVYTLYRADR